MGKAHGRLILWIFIPVFPHTAAALIFSLGTIQGLVRILQYGRQRFAGVPNADTGGTTGPDIVGKGILTDAPAYVLPFFDSAFP